MRIATENQKGTHGCVSHATKDGSTKINILETLHQGTIWDTIHRGHLVVLHVDQVHIQDQEEWDDVDLKAVTPTDKISNEAAHR